MKLNNAQFADALPRERDRAYNFKVATPGQRSATGCHRNKFHDSQFIRNKKKSSNEDANKYFVRCAGLWLDVNS